MTRKDYELIATILRGARADEDGKTNLDALIERFAVDLHAASSFNRNGNKSFDVDRFVKAATA